MNEFAYIGAGCFWHVEEHYSVKKGVLSTTVGYMGGITPNPNYKIVCSGTTGHAEIVKINFDSTKISYEEILKQFWRIHNPCTLNRQGYDVGTQYRSVIYYTNEKQKNEALRQIKLLTQKAIYKEKIVTEISQAKKFYKAEDYHQKYFKKNPMSVHLYCKIPEID